MIEALPNDPLGDLCASFRKGIFDIKAESYVDPGEGVPFIRITDIKTGMIQKHATAWIDRAAHTLEEKTALKFGDLVLSKTAYPAAAIVNLQECNVSQDTIAVRLSADGKRQYRSGYVAAFLNSKQGLSLMARRFQGNVQQHLSLEDGRSLRIPRLDVKFQDRVHALVLRVDQQQVAVTNLMLAAEERLLNALSLADWTPSEPLTYSAKLSDYAAEGRLDAQFYRPKFDELFRLQAARFELFRLDGVVLKGRTVPYVDGGEVPIIRSGDLSDIDDDARFLRAASTEPVFYLRKGDILISSIGFGSIGKVQVFDKIGRFGTVSEVTVVRQSTLNPYYLATYLRSAFGQMQIDRYITGATGQLHLNPKDVEKFFIPVVPAADQLAFEHLSQEVFKTKARALTLLTAAKRAVEIAIEESEAAAMAFLTQAEEAP